jgi:hypothetical protein
LGPVLFWGSSRIGSFILTHAILEFPLHLKEGGRVLRGLDPVCRIRSLILRSLIRRSAVLRSALRGNGTEEGSHAIARC